MWEIKHAPLFCATSISANAVFCGTCWFLLDTHSQVEQHVKPTTWQGCFLLSLGLNTAWVCPPLACSDLKCWFPVEHGIFHGGPRACPASPVRGDGWICRPRCFPRPQAGFRRAKLDATFSEKDVGFWVSSRLASTPRVGSSFGVRRLCPCVTFVGFVWNVTTVSDGFV